MTSLDGMDLVAAYETLYRVYGNRADEAQNDFFKGLELFMQLTGRRFTPVQKPDDQDPTCDLPEDLRETLGRRVRDIWVQWAREQKNPKPSWLVEWDQLPENDKEVDRRIGAAIYRDCLHKYEKAISCYMDNQANRGESP